MLKYLFGGLKRQNGNTAQRYNPQGWDDKGRDWDFQKLEAQRRAPLSGVGTSGAQRRGPRNWSSDLCEGEGPPSSWSYYLHGHVNR